MVKNELETTVAVGTRELATARHQAPVEPVEHKRAENSPDTAGRQRAEDLLRQSENRFRTLAETASDAIITIDESGRIVFINKAAEKVFGYSEQEMLDAELTMLMPEYLRHLHQAGFARYKETGERHMSWQAIELPGLHKNGNEIPLELSFGEFAQGEQHFFTGIARDITERKRVEEAWRRTEFEYRSLVESIQAIVWRGDARTFQFSFVSKEAETLLGYTAEQWTSDPMFWSDHIHPEDKDWAVSFCVRATEEKRDHQFEYRIIAADGRVVWLRDIVRVVVEEGGVKELVGVMIDITERKLAEEALRQSEKKFSTIFQTIPDPVAILRLRDVRVLDLNDAWTKQTGYLKSERVGKSGEEFNIYVDRDLRGRHAAELIEKGEIHNLEAVYRRKDDSLMDGLMSARVIELDGEQCAVAIIKDITDLKTAEQAVRRSEERYRLIVENQTEFIVKWLPDGTRTFVNESYCRYFGIPEAECLGSSFFNLVSPYFRKEIRRRTDSLTPGAPEYTEEHLSIVAGGERWQQWTNRGIFDANGKLIELLSSGRDITERKNAQEALQNSETRGRRLNERFSLAVESAGIGVWDIDLLNNEVVWDQQMYILYQVDPREFSGAYEAWAGRVHPDDQRRANDEVQQAIQGVKPFDTDFRVVWPSGEARHIRAFARVVCDDSGAPLRMTGINYDITDRKRAEEQVKQSREQLRALSGHLQSVREEERTMIAREIHDELGQALTALKMDLSAIQNGLRKGGVATHDGLTERTVSMSRLIDETIQTVRRIATDLRPGILDDLGLVAAIEWQAQDFQNRTGIICRFTPDIEDLDVDQDRSTALFRMFQETLTNVARHSEATEVAVTLNRTDDSLTLDIEDNGKGISTADISGNGSLGLLGMRERANLLGGNLHISGTPAKGTIVTVRIPLT